MGGTLNLTHSRGNYSDLQSTDISLEQQSDRAKVGVLPESNSIHFGVCVQCDNMLN